MEHQRFAVVLARPPSAFYRKKNDKFSHVSRSILCVWWYLHFTSLSRAVHFFLWFSREGEARRGSRWKMEIDLYLNDAQHEWLIAVFIRDCSFFLFPLVSSSYSVSCTVTHRQSASDGEEKVLRLNGVFRERPISVKPANKMPIAASVFECMFLEWSSRKPGQREWKAWRELRHGWRVLMRSCQFGVINEKLF